MVLDGRTGIYVRSGARSEHFGILASASRTMCHHAAHEFSTAPKSVAEIEQLMSQD
jgi:hypothetical protein